jgi:hypothetical protein
VAGALIPNTIRHLICGIRELWRAQHLSNSCGTDEAAAKQVERKRQIAR